MKQVVKLFTGYEGYDNWVDININKFLEEHPNHIIDKIAFASEENDRALVVFNIKEPTHSKAVGITRSGETKTIEFEGKKSGYPRCNRCINNWNCFGQKDYQDNCEDFKDAKD
jgi:hypothetical protein